jgi:hypothetical protein
MDFFLLRDAFAAANLSPPVGRIKLPYSLVYERAGATGKLLSAADGKLDVKDYDRTVATLMSGGSDPVITRKPEGAYFAVYDAMK